MQLLENEYWMMITRLSVLGGKLFVKYYLKFLLTTYTVEPFPSPCNTPIDMSSSV